MKFRHYIYILIVVLFTGCTKLVEVSGPPTSINKDNVYGSDATAVAVLNGIYAKMSSMNLTDAGSVNSFMSLYPGLSADEFELYPSISGSLQLYYLNELTNGASPNFWNVAYPYLFNINTAIEGLNESTSLTPAVKNQLLGEAKFLRAFHYFYLVNLYGDVPLVVGTDYKENSLIPRTNKDDVYKQIVTDLLDAVGLLSDTYLDINVSRETSERVAPVKWAAIALLARVYLYEGDYDNAEKQASLVINNTSLYSLVGLNEVFLMNSAEAIWQLQPVNIGWNTEDARLFIIPDSGPSDSWPVYLSKYVLNSFEPEDQRRRSWVDSVIVDTDTFYFPFKYKESKLDNPISEYKMMLRLGEQYLIRAESRAENADFNGAIEDLNIIRTRAGLEDYKGEINKEAILNAVYHERQVELFTEWGDRWLDLKRTGRINSIMSKVASQKGGNWSSDAQLYPISSYELKYNRNLVQNPGY